MGIKYLQTIYVCENRTNCTGTYARKGGTYNANLCRIFRAFMAYGFVPIAWRQVRVMSIRKPGKLNYISSYKNVVFAFENDGETSR
jgi:hypothetical protein